MTNGEYLDMPGISATAIKAGAVSMAHMHIAATRRTASTPAMEWGTLVHMAVLEPGRLGSDVAVWDGGRRAGKEYAARVAANSGRHVVKPGQLEELNDISAAVRNHADASRLLAGCKYERVLGWREGGSVAKARLDGIGTGSGAKLSSRIGRVIDIKTIANIDQAARQCFRYNYHLQMGWYTHGAEFLYGKTYEAYLIFVESHAPHCVACYRLGYDVLEYGQREAVRIATEYAACQRTGVYTGLPGGVRVLDLPPWIGEEAAEVDLSDGTMEGAEL